MCGCAFFVSKAYLDYYGRKPWTPETQNNPTKPASQESSLSNFTFKKANDVEPELERKALGKVNTYLNSLELIREGKFDELDEILEKEEKDSQDCDICAADAEIVRANAQFVDKVCKYGDPACEEEIGRLIQRTEEVITENFMVAGYQKVPVNSGKKAHQSKVKDTRRNAWTEFVAEISKHPTMAGKSGKYRMKIAASLYHNKYETIEEAMENIPE
jgi:hypothetical protein